MEKNANRVEQPTFRDSESDAVRNSRGSFQPRLISQNLTYNVLFDSETFKINDDWRELMTNRALVSSAISSRVER